MQRIDCIEHQQQLNSFLVKSLMKPHFLLFSSLLFGLFNCYVVTAQSVDCVSPNSFIFDEFYSDEVDLQLKIKEFERKILETTGSLGLVVPFASKKARVDDEKRLMSLAEKSGTIAKPDYNSRIYIRFGGYRLRESFVFILRPEQCSSYSLPVADFSADQIQFEGYSDEKTLRYGYGELRSKATSSPDKKCPPAARAVRACDENTSVDVFILVDQTGSVVFGEAIAAHPLLKAAAAAGVKEWKFPPLVIDGNSMNQSGMVKISFEEGPDILSNE